MLQVGVGVTCENTNIMIGLVERRRDERWRHFANMAAAVDGHMAPLQDLSTWGARVECGRSFPDNAVVRLDLPFRAPIRATVLHSDGKICRLRFDFPLDEF